MRIDDYEFGRLVVDGETYTSDVLMWPDGIDDSWWRNRGHSLCMDDLSDLMDKDFDVLVIGTGARGVMNVPADTLEQIEEACGEVHVATTDEACEKFNELAEQSDRRVAAALHLTC
ncbi:MAG: Mth938-like domain-containing protein [Planctomycetota bacterium]